MTAKRPIILKDGDKEFFICPQCGRTVLSTKNFMQSGIQENFCNACGQKIDWSHETIKTYWPPSGYFGIDS